MTSTLIDRLAGVAEGQAIKVPCRVATTANITLAGLQTIDGIAIAEGDRVLVKNQTDTTLNGIYNASTGNWVRAADFDGARDVVRGTRIGVLDGTDNAGSAWEVSSTAVPILFGSSAITFTPSIIQDMVSLAMRAVTNQPNLAAGRVAFGLGTGRYGVSADTDGYLRKRYLTLAVAAPLAAALTHDSALMVVSGARTITLPRSQDVGDGYGFYVYTLDGATATLTPDSHDGFDDLALAASLTVHAGRLVWVTTDGAAAGAWRASPIGTWHNAPLSITGATAVTNLHDGCTLRLGGAAFYALTFPAAATLRPNFRCVIVNTESTPIGKGIAGIDVGSFQLYPGESYTVYNDAGTLRLLGGTVKQYRKSSIALYVDGTNGNDSPLVADGLSTGVRAYKTIGAAITALYRAFDHNSSFPTITVAAGTYNESITVSGTLTGAGSNLFFLNGASPVDYSGAGGAYASGVRWRPAGAGTPYCLLIGDLGILSWSNIHFDSTIVGTAIQMHQASVCDQNGGGGFGSFGNPGGVHIGFDGAGATYNISASYAVSGAGGAAVHVSLPAVGQLNHAGGVTVTIGTAGAQPNVGVWFRGVGSGSNIALGSAIVWVNSPLAGCQKWLAGTLASLALSGNGANVPGTVAGSPPAGAAPAANLGMVTA